MHSLLRRLGVRERDLDDVLQRALFSLYRHWEEYDEDRPLRAWVRVFVQRAASDYRKAPEYDREVLRDDDELLLSVLDEAPDPELVLEAAERRALLLDALDALDFDRRTVLVLTEFEGMAAPEIASLLVIPVATVHSRLRLARVDIARAVRRLAARRRMR